LFITSDTGLTGDSGNITIDEGTGTLSYGDFATSGDFQSDGDINTDTTYLTFARRID